MDVLYIGDIPQNYKFARFGSNYVDLFNTQTLHNGTYTFYRIYFYDNFFAYDVGALSVGQYTTYNCIELNVSDQVVYRRDFCNIVVLTFIIALFGLWLFNLFTSIVRKGGLFGGLL